MLIGHFKFMIFTKFKLIYFSLVLYIKKGTALTIPYSGEPERPRRSNYPFNGGFVSQKTLFSKCENAVFISLLTYIIHIFQKKSTGNIYNFRIFSGRSYVLRVMKNYFGADKLTQAMVQELIEKMRILMYYKLYN